MTPVKFAHFTGDRIFTGEVHRAISACMFCLVGPRQTEQFRKSRKKYLATTYKPFEWISVRVQVLLTFVQSQGSLCSAPLRRRRSLTAGLCLVAGARISPDSECFKDTAFTLVLINVS